jgi:hypothetical protein
MIGLNVENILKSANPKNPNSDNGRHSTVKVRNDFQQGDNEPQTVHFQKKLSQYWDRALL